MFKELIEEIEKYQEQYANDDCCDTINDIITIIESYKPKELDKPDSEGWWWFSCSGVLFPVELFYKDGILTFIDRGIFRTVDEKRFERGKWIKEAIA